MNLFFIHTTEHDINCPEDKRYVLLYDSDINQPSQNNFAIRLPKCEYFCSKSLESLRFLYYRINTVDDSEYVGFSTNQTMFKYRNLDVLYELFNKYKCIVSQAVTLGEYTFLNHYSYFYSSKELDDCIDIINDLFPDYTDTIDKCLNMRYLINPDAFVFTRDIFKEYCEFIFTVINKLTENVGRSKKDRFQYVVNNFSEYNQQNACCEMFINEQMNVENHIWKFLHNLFLQYKYQLNDIATLPVVCDRKNKDAKSYNPLVSVIIPAYKQADYLRDAVDSLFKQTFTDWEAVIVDDGSTDGVREYAEYFASIDNRIRFYHTQNRGVAAARNFAASKCTGVYLMNLDADNVLHPDYMSICLKMFEKYPDIKIASTKYKHFELYLSKLEKEDVNGVFSEKNIEYNKFILQNIHEIHAHSMYRREDFIRVGGYDEYMEYGYEDWEMWTRICDDNSKFAMTESPYMYYRLKPDSRNFNAQKHNYEIFSYLFDKHRDVYARYYNMDKLLEILKENFLGTEK